MFVCLLVQLVVFYRSVLSVMFRLVLSVTFKNNHLLLKLTLTEAKKFTVPHVLVLVYMF
jgi:hypothetical protein